MDVSIILVNYKTVGLLCGAIDSIMDKSGGISFEIIVVDNASEDNSRQEVARRYGDRVNYVSLPENIGFGRANNKAIRIAQGRHIFLLNPDTVLVNNAVKILSDYLDQHPATGVCGGNLYDAQMNPTVSYERFLPSLWVVAAECLHLYRGGSYQFNHDDRPRRVGYISGADMMIRREALQQAGLFDPDFFMYAEEAELTYRIRKKGYVSVSVPAARIIHLEGKSFDFSERRARMQFAGRALYFRKCFGCYGAALFIWLMRMMAWLRVWEFQLRRRPELVYQWRAQLQVYRSKGRD